MYNYQDPSFSVCVLCRKIISTLFKRANSLMKKVVMHSSKRRMFHEPKLRLVQFYAHNKERKSNWWEHISSGTTELFTPTWRSYTETLGQENFQKRKQHVTLGHGWQFRNWRRQVRLGGRDCGKGSKKWDWSIDREPSKDSKPGLLFTLCNLKRMIQTLLRTSCFHWGNSLLHMSLCMSLF